MYQDMSQDLIELIELAEEIARLMHDSNVGSEHLLLAILKLDNSYFAKQLAEYDMTYLSVKDDLLKCYHFEEAYSLIFTKAVEDIFEFSILHAREEKREKCELEDLYYTLLHYECSLAFEILLEYHVNIPEIEKGIAQNITMNELNKIKELTNLNLKMENQRPVVLCRENEIMKIITVLSRKEKSNPLLIGEPGTGKSAIIEEIARRISNNEISDCLKNYVIYELNINNLVAGTKYRGEFEEKIEKICQSVKKYNKVILFIDEIHQIVGAGKAEGSIDVATVFKPYLARNEIRVIGATTIAEYTKFIEKDRALERRFQTLVLEEPDVEMTLKMITNKVNGLKRYHHVDISNDVVKQAVLEADNYLLSRHFPDKAIDVIDLACTRAKLLNHKSVSHDDIKQVISDLCNTHFEEHIDYSKLNLRYPKYNHIIERLDELSTTFNESIDELPKAVWNFKSKSAEDANQFVCDVAKVFNTNNIILPMQLYNEATSLYELTSSKDSTFYKPWNDLKKTSSFVFVLLNFDRAHNDVKKFFYNIFETGKWKNNDGVVHDFRHSIFLITSSLDSSSALGFNSEYKVRGNSYFDEEFVLEKMGKEEYLNVAKEYLNKYDVEIASDELEVLYEEMGEKYMKKYLKLVINNIKKNSKNKTNAEKDMVK